MDGDARGAGGVGGRTEGNTKVVIRSGSSSKVDDDDGGASTTSSLAPKASSG